ncbi:MAG: deoxyribodipyrimidine photo-lyase [Sphingomonadales bacterium]|nr:deoxyribodipyrimidine photo-lyase [Sphingomonadales bacterium]
MAAPSILWFRQDLRLSDNAALLAAVEAGPVVAVYILDDKAPGEHAIGGAQRWWLHYSLTALAASLEAKGATLILRRGDSVGELNAISKETGASRIFATRLYEPWWKAIDAKIGDRLTLLDGNYLAPPTNIRTGGGGRYKIFTPYWNALSQQMPPASPQKAPHVIKGATAKSDKLNEWKLLPTRPDWSKGFDAWNPGEVGAKAALRHFLDEVGDYDRARNMPSEHGTSQLSPHLHHGEISPSTVWHHIAQASGNGQPYLREIGWRDYAANTIDQFPDYGTANARPGFDKLRWRTGKDADADFTAWAQGRTGYPIVDAGMRQLWTMGWMHNRLRMITASFMIKHLLIDWRRGERWFWDTLVDADYNSNSVNWQWVAGTGVDSNMFVRIMAPLVQSEKFDAGDYIRQWVPELAKLPDATIHDPHGAGVAPPDYPAPLIGHREGRERALAAYRAMKS